MGYGQALSGLDASAQALDVIGNNIANSATTGFKTARAEFADVYANSLWGSSSTAVGIGTSVAAVAPIFTQGNITTTGNPLDIAINGQGFFREVNNGVTTYSRDGQFSLNASGGIVNSTGAQLTGYPAGPNNTIASTPPQPLTLSTAPVPPSASTTANFTLNLPGNATSPTGTFSPTNPTTYNSSTSMSLYDSLGNAHTLTMYFVKGTGTTPTWNVYGTVDGTALASQLGSMTFNSSGALSGVNSGTATGSTNPAGTMSLSFTPTNGSNPVNVAVSFPSSTQYGVPFAVSSNVQNGYTTGQLAGFSIGSDGTIIGNYTNGQTVAQGQIALANFTNPQGLSALSNNQFAETSASGAPVVGAPGSGSMGTLQSGALEQSTVDLTTELVNMISAQRAYQGNAEMIKTEDQVQQTLMTLR